MVRFRSNALTNFPFTTSPVFRDALHMDSLRSEGSQPDDLHDGKPIEPSNVTFSQTVPVEGSFDALLWLFGVLENRSVDDLFPQMLICGSDDAKNLIEALVLADKYDLAFFPRLLTDYLYGLARRSHWDAAIIYHLAYRMKDTTLARYAVKKMVKMPAPPLTSSTYARIMGIDPYWALVDAYERLKYNQNGGPDWASTAKHWRKIADVLSLPTAECECVLDSPRV